MRTRRAFLSRAEEKELAIRALAGDTEARNRIVMGMLPFLHLLAHRVATRFGGDREDMVQAAIVRILDKFHSYNPHRGHRASTYFGRAALHVMRDQAIRLDKIIYTPANKYAPCEAEVYRARNGVRSFSETMYPDPNSPLVGDTIPDARATPADEPISRAEQAALLRRSLRQLPPKMHKVIQGRMAGRKLQEIADDLDLSKERVRQIEDEGRKMLAGMLGGA